MLELEERSNRNMFIFYLPEFISYLNGTKKLTDFLSDGQRVRFKDAGLLELNKRGMRLTQKALELIEEHNNNVET